TASLRYLYYMSGLTTKHEDVLSRSLTTYALLCIILLQLRCVQTVDITAGNSRCMEDHKCSRHGDEFFWCYTNQKGVWEYCCDGPCFDAEIIESIQTKRYITGTKYAFCGSTGGTAADGTKCRSSHPCGLHGRFITQGYWCYDDYGNRKECCNPRNETCINASTSDSRETESL
ncbi:hypothetical protein CHS0354_028542, partial [Potamilus streckersoni]